MSSTPPSEADDGSASLQELIAEYGHTAGPRIADFTRLATAAQLQRRNMKLSDTEQITRSTALWALMTLDGDIRAALETGGVDHAALGETLQLERAPTPIDVATATLREYFARAVRSYLSERSDHEPIDLPDLAVAILNAGRDDPSGLLPDRLKRLSIDYDTAIPAVERLLTRPDLGPGPGNYEDFSESVREVRHDLGGESIVTAGQIAEALQAEHPQYAGGAFGQVDLGEIEGTPAATDDWLGRVRSLYDLAKVAKTRHRVIDGELTLLGLATLDTALAARLGDHGFLDALRRGAEIAPRGPISERTQLAPDAPAEKDLLGREQLAEALVKRLRLLAEPGSQASRRSFLIHVDGPWGAGKSTLFEFLERQLEPEFLVVNVNAWREQRVGVQWWTLLSALRREVLASMPWYKRPSVWFAGLFDRVRAGWVPFAAAILVLGAALAGLLSVADFSVERSGDVADSALKIASLVAAAFAGLAAAARFLLPGSRKSAQGFVQTSDNPMQEVVRLFARTLHRAKRPVVFLIDDLDRCDEDYVVEFLEVMQTLVRDAPIYPNSPGRRRYSEFAGPYAFIAADGQWIRSSYENHYASSRQTLAPGRPLGYLFLEKIFQLHVRLPTITASTKEAFLASLLLPRDGGAPSDDSQGDAIHAAKTAVREAKSESEVVEAARGVTDIADPRARMEILGDAAVKLSERAIINATEHALSPYAKFLEPNPRSMKLYVNTYGVLLTLRTLEEVFVPLQALALWTVIEIRWPYLADYLRAHPDAVKLAKTNKTIPDDIKFLLADREIGLVLGDTESGPLTPDLIRQCSGSP